MLKRRGLNFGIDVPEPTWVSGSEFVLTGWAASSRSAEPIEILATNGDIESRGEYGLARPDVARHFGSEIFSNCGFVIRVRAPLSTQPAHVWARQGKKKISLISFDPVACQAVEPTADYNSYQEWIRRNEPRLFVAERDVPAFLADLGYRPLLSIVLPTYNTPNYLLRRCLDSVVNQHYPNWQLCVGDDDSTNQETLRTLDDYAKTHTRIQLARRARQGGISAASNTALQNAEGEYIILLDHDDELHPAALLEVVRALNEYRHIKLLYSDEDKIDEFGVRTQPAFKPDFDRELLLSFNYLGHLIALDRGLVNDICGFRSETDGAQDWDLLIRATERIPDCAVGHIRKPLYHWRIHESSTSTNLDAKPYAAKAWQRVLQDHAARTSKQVEVSPGLFYGSMRLKYEAPMIDVGVFVRPENGLFQSAIIRGRAQRSSIYKVIGVDVIPEASPSHQPLGTSRELRGNVLVFFNAPLESLSHLFFEELIAQALRPECGVATGMAVDAFNRTLSTGYMAQADDALIDPYAGTQLPDHGYMGQVSIIRSVEACSPLMFAVRREHLMAIGGLAAISSFEMPGLAAVLCGHARENGLSVIYTPYAVACFSLSDVPFSQHAAGARHHAPVRINPNLASLSAVLLPQRNLQLNSSCPQ